MCHRKWMELKYHPRKADKVTNVLSRKETYTAELMVLEHNLLEKL